MNKKILQNLLYYHSARQWNIYSFKKCFSSNIANNNQPLPDVQRKRNKDISSILDKQNKLMKREKIDPKDTSVILFPGQGMSTDHCPENLSKAPFHFRKSIRGYGL